MRPVELEQHGVPAALTEIWGQHIESLTDVQERAVAAGLLSGSGNFLVVAPTSSGKTFVAEMAATSLAYQTRRQVIFVVPYRALAEEHYLALKRRYEGLLSVVIATGDWAEFDADIRDGNYGIAVMTYEKLIGFLVDRPQILDRCAALIVDEIQILGERGRGPDLELLLTQVLTHPRSPRVLALSASLDDLGRLDDWLGATLVMTNERPVPLSEGVLDPASGQVLSTDLSRSPLCGPQLDAEDAAAAATVAAVNDGEQVLVFRASLAKTVLMADKLRRSLPIPGLDADTARDLDDLEPSPSVEHLRRLLAARVAYHNADLTGTERRAVEGAFRRGACRALVSTTTLAMGVNLPTDLVIIPDTRRYSPDQGNWRTEDISVAEYKNAAGRAGRLGMRTAGRAIVVAGPGEVRQVLDFYCRGRVEPITSRLPDQPFDDLVFSVVASGLAGTEAEIVEFVTRTLAYPAFYEWTGGISSVQEGVASATRSCVAGGLLESEQGRLVATAVGRGFAARHVPVRWAAYLAGETSERPTAGTPTVELLHVVSGCDDLFEARPYVKWNRLLRRPIDLRPALSSAMASSDPESPLAQALASAHPSEVQLRVLARTDCLARWRTGEEATAIGRSFEGCSPSRLTGMAKVGAWILEATAEAEKARGRDAAVIARLASEVRYGVPAELVPLARLNVRGVARGSLIRLYEGGRDKHLHDPDVLLDAEDDDLAGLLTPLEAARLREAVIAERGETQTRRRRAQTERARVAELAEQLIDDLYTLGGVDLERAVADALAAVGIPATRIHEQKHGEEDLQIRHPDGTVVVSVTASLHPSKNIVWSKVREVLAAGVGMNPINYVCIGRPAFHSEAESLARQIGLEEGPRNLLLIPMDVFADAVIRCAEGRLDSGALLDAFGRASGVLSLDELGA